MEYVVYVLYSEKYDRLYIGFTSNLIERMKSHNILGKGGYTSRFRPWFVVYLEFFEEKADSLKREKQLKTSGGRTFIRSKILPKYN